MVSTVLKITLAVYILCLLVTVGIILKCGMERVTQPVPQWTFQWIPPATQPAPLSVSAQPTTQIVNKMVSDLQFITFATIPARSTVTGKTAGIFLAAAVRNKFNATSAEHNLNVKL